jgi:hypothetical protein
VTDGRGKLKHANMAADQLLGDGAVLILSGGIVTAVSSLARAALADAISRGAANGGESLGARGIGIPLSRPGETPVVAYVLPLGSGEFRHTLGPADVAVFVSIGNSHVPRGKRSS